MSLDELTKIPPILIKWANSLATSIYRFHMVNVKDTVIAVNNIFRAIDVLTIEFSSYVIDSNILSLILSNVIADLNF